MSDDQAPPYVATDDETVSAPQAPSFDDSAEFLLDDASPSAQMNDLFDLRAEQAVIGSVLTDGHVYLRLAGVLESDDFYDNRHRIVWQAFTLLHQRGREIDFLTVSAHLREIKQIEKAGGDAYLAGMTAGVPTVGHAGDYAQIVVDFSLRRRLASTAENIAQIAVRAETTDRLVGAAERTLANAVSRSYARQPKLVADMLSGYTEELQARALQPGTSGVPTGISDLDAYLGGLQKSDLIILAGRPGMGKTACELTTAANAAETGARVAFFSLEMSEEQILQRLIAMYSGIDYQRLRSGALREDDWPLYAMAVERLSSLMFFIDDTPAISVSQMRAKCRTLSIENGGLDLVVVDYLQLMAAEVRTDNREQEISRISRGLKQLAKELNIPVLAAAQLSRALESRADKRPQLSDLRESGSIEQDSDVVIFVYRGEMYEPDKIELRGLAELIIGKHRNGPLGTAEVLFIASTSTFEDAPDGYMDDE